MRTWMGLALGYSWWGTREKRERSYQEAREVRRDLGKLFVLVQQKGKRIERVGVFASITFPRVFHLMRFGLWCGGKRLGRR